MRSLSTVWTRSVQNPDRKKSLEDAIRNSSVALTRMKEILLEDEKSLSTMQVNQPDNDPSWAYKQAHISGERNRIRKILDLLSFLGD